MTSVFSNNLNIFCEIECLYLITYLDNFFKHVFQYADISYATKCCLCSVRMKALSLGAIRELNP